MEAGIPRSLSWLEEGGEAKETMKHTSEEAHKPRRRTFSQICMWEHVCVWFLFKYSLIEDVKEKQLKIKHTERNSNFSIRNICLLFYFLNIK